MTMPRELALGSAINQHINAAITSRNPKDVNDQLRIAAHLAAILHEQCSAYHVALQQIAALAKPGCAGDVVPFDCKLRMDIWHVLDNLDQPL